MAWRSGRLAGAAAAAALACTGCGEAAELGRDRGGVSAGPTSLPAGEGPAVLVRPNREAAPKGTEITFQVEHRGLPPGAGLVLTLVRDVPTSEIGYQGATGPLTPKPLPIGPDQRTAFVWNGRDVACAPADAPTWCPAEVGRYRIHAQVFDRADFGLVGWPDRSPRTLLAESVSEPFLLTGEPDLTVLEPMLRALAVQRVADSLFTEKGRTGTGAFGPIARSLDRLGPVARTGAGICAEYEATPPFRGRLRACAPARSLTEAGLRVRREDVTASGDVDWAAGVVPYPRAEAAALAAADAAYVGRVRFGTQPTREQLGIPAGTDFQAWSRANPLGSTYLSSGVMDWTYRQDAGAWAFLISEIMAGGQESAPGRFADAVAVRVDGAGRACIVAVRPYKGPRFDILKDPLVCR